MGYRSRAALILGLTLSLGRTAQAAFVTQGDGSPLEDFNDGVLDTDTWTSATQVRPDECGHYKHPR